MRLIVQTREGKVWQSWTYNPKARIFNSTQPFPNAAYHLDDLEYDLRVSLKALAIEEGLSPLPEVKKR